MSHDTLIGIVVPVSGASQPDGLKRLSEIASACHADLPAGRIADEARFFLRSVKEGNSVFFGTKGDSITWGSVFNYASEVQFLDHLQPFFKSLATAGFVGHYDRAMVFLASLEPAEKPPLTVGLVSPKYPKQLVRWHELELFRSPG